MAHLNLLQQTVAIIFPLALVLFFFYATFRRKGVALGNFLVTIVPAAIFVYLVFILKLPFDLIKSDAVYAVGIALLVSGVVLSKAAFRHIGYVNSDDFWSSRTANKKRTLVTSGPYKYIRHPLALSIIVSYAGLVLVFFHLASLVIYLASVAFIIFTSFHEEKFMQERFPEYAGYKKSAGMFWPK